VIVTLLAIGIAMRAYQQHRYAGRIDLGSVWVYGLAACIWLLHLMSDVMQGQATLSVSANEERLAWSTHPWRRERSLPMSEVREFAVEAKPKGYALVVHPQLWRSEHARWYPFASAKSQPIVLLTHTDPVFAYRAAEALNALLAPADDLAATPFLPPPPSPDPPS
jgi:hypothetical protein